MIHMKHHETEASSRDFQPKLEIPVAGICSCPTENTNVHCHWLQHRENTNVWRQLRQSVACNPYPCHPTPKRNKMSPIIVLILWSFFRNDCYKFEDQFHTIHIPPWMYILLNHSKAEFKCIQALNISTSFFLQRNWNTVSHTFYSYTLYTVWQQQRKLGKYMWLYCNTGQRICVFNHNLQFCFRKNKKQKTKF